MDTIGQHELTANCYVSSQAMPKFPVNFKSHHVMSLLVLCSYTYFFSPIFLWCYAYAWWWWRWFIGFGGQRAGLQCIHIYIHTVKEN